MKKVFSFLCLSVVSLTVASVMLYVKIAKAADALPDPFVPCLEDEIGKPEFNSQRPYQASPCGDSAKAYFCQNNYIIEEKVQRRWRPGACNDSGGVYICSVDENFDKNYEVSMSNVELPILGNTQDTKNATTSKDKIDDAQKVNEYLAWYLSGTNQKAENGIDDNDKIINFSGPTKKILPSVIQELQRFKVLHDAGTKTEYTDSEEFKTNLKDLDPKKEGLQVEETENHNQVVVCTAKNFLGIQNPWLGPEVPIPCHGTQEAAMAGASGVSSGIGGSILNNIFNKNKSGDNGQYRLLNWWEGKYTGYLKSFELIKGWDGSERWGSTVPPFPWQFEKDVYYRKAYNEWRGKECLLILGKLICADLKIPGVAELHTNVWADFYQYIPLGNTVDRNAGHMIGDNGSVIKGLGKTLAEKQDGEEIEQTPVLFYPHTTSTVNMLDALNESHTPKGSQMKKKDANDVISSPDIETQSCEVVDVRSNPGDDLTFDNPVIKDKQRIAINHVRFHVSQIECDSEIKNWFDDCGQIQPNAAFDDDPDNNKCDTYPMCKGTVQVILPTTPKIPYANAVWNDAVAGQTSAFRRIFPKIEEGSPVSCIADIPGVSEVDYTPSADTNLTALDTPGGRVRPDEAQLFFPHLGGIYEYFLKGIQTALRPKGYGEPITNGKLCTNTTDQGDCSFSVSKALSAARKAADKYKVPFELLKTIFEIESAPYIADPSSYQCQKENSAGAIGVAQFKKETVDKMVTCAGEQMTNDIGMCGDYGKQLSRCSIDDSFELMARLLLYQAGKLNNCQPTGSISLDNVSDWYVPVCMYYGKMEPDAATAQYGQGIPANERRPDGDMNYCDIVCHKLGKCPPYPVR